MARKEKVTKVIDGDTFETASRKNPVRLANVNAPEKGQPGAGKATQALRNLIQGEEVLIDTVARDQYGRSFSSRLETGDFCATFSKKVAKSTSVIISTIVSKGAHMQHTLTDQQWRTFDEQGHARLGKIATDEELAGLRQRIDEIMMGVAAVPYDRIMMQLDTTTGVYKDMSPQTKGHKGATLAYRKIQDLEFDPLFLTYMQKPLFRHICERVYGAGIPISCFRAMFMNKPARQGTHLPWHQDFFPHLDRYPVATVWMAMDASTIENGCVKVLPGSHHTYPDDDDTVFLSEEQTAEMLERFTPAYLECEAGEGLLLHNRLIHSSEVNPTDRPRRAFSVCYMDGRTTSKQGNQTFSVIFGEGALKPEEAGVG